MLNGPSDFDFDSNCKIFQVVQNFILKLDWFFCVARVSTILLPFVLCLQCFVCLLVVSSLYKFTCKLCCVSPLDEPFVALGTNTCIKYVYIKRLTIIDFLAKLFESFISAKLRRGLCFIFCI